MAAEGSTPFEQAVPRAMTSWLGVGGARFHTGGEAGEADTVYLGVVPARPRWSGWAATTRRSCAPRTGR